MAFITTNPSPFIVNLPELQNVQTSASGASALTALSDTVNNVITFINTDTSALSINTIGAYNRGTVTMTAPLSLSNAGVQINDVPILGSNSLNGIPYITFQINNQNYHRITNTGLGINTLSPQAALDVRGNATVTGNLYVTTAGAPVTSTIGNAYIDGDVFASGIKYPSDPILKQDIKPYIPHTLPDAYEFTWKSSGLRDIGVMADELQHIEPACVYSGTNGLAVDYPKLVVLCLSELKRLQNTVADIQATLLERAEPVPS